MGCSTIDVAVVVTASIKGRSVSFQTQMSELAVNYFESKHHIHVGLKLGPDSYVNYSMSWWFCGHSTLVCVLFDDWKFFLYSFWRSSEAETLTPEIQ